MSRRSRGSVLSFYFNSVGTRGARLGTLLAAVCVLVAAHGPIASAQHARFVDTPPAMPSNTTRSELPGRISRSTTAGVPIVTGARVGTLRTYVPTASEFVLRGTIPIPTRRFQRQTCPFVVVDPAGTALQTQWELVAVLDQYMVVEILALVSNTAGWSGQQTFDVFEGTSSYDLTGFDPNVLTALLTPGLIVAEFHDQNGNTLYGDLTNPAVRHTPCRVGSAMITIERDYTGAGGLQVWLSATAGSDEIEVVLNWHNGGLPAQPDLYFSSLGLRVPPGYAWTPLLPDPAMSYPLLVKKGQHILPQQWERSFRVIVHPIDKTPDVSRRGWAIGDWTVGGYMAQGLRVPDLSHTKIDLTIKKVDDYDRLSRGLATAVGLAPVNFLWPAQGVYYGGMTGGVDVYHYPAVALAYSGQPDGLLSTYVEQLRYASRQKGCIYEANGMPIEQEDYLEPDRTQAFNLFNNVFIGNDAPFNFSSTGPGVGSSTYDPNVFSPIDYQHFVRRTKANKTLVWLDNDPLAKRYLMMDAELGRMCFYEGPAGRMRLPTNFGLGTGMGRAEAWVADVMATAHAISPKKWRARNRAWFSRFVQILEDAQLPTGLYSATMYGKMATSPPYGNGQVASYWAYRTNEQIFLMLGLRAIQNSVGIDCSDLIRRCGEGLWNFAWKVGTDGPLDTYPAGPVGGPRYRTRSEIPAGLTDPVLRDSWYVANAIASAQIEGANMLPAVLAVSKTTSLSEARDVFERWGLQNIANRASALSLLQQLAP